MCQQIKALALELISREKSGSRDAAEIWLFEKQWLQTINQMQTCTVWMCHN